MCPGDRCGKGCGGQTVAATLFPLQGYAVYASEWRNYSAKTGSSFVTPEVCMAEDAPPALNLTIFYSHQNTIHRSSRPIVPAESPSLMSPTLMHATLFLLYLITIVFQVHTS